MAPAGNSSFSFALFCAGISAGLLSAISTPTMTEFLCDMDLHLVDGVVKIPTRIPRRFSRLHTATAVGGARLYDVIASLCIPGVSPQAPRVAGLLTTQCRRIPTQTAINRDFHFDDIGFPGPGRTVHRHLARL